MIRTKEIDYLDSPCIAIYFQSMTTHVEQFRLESQILEEKNLNATLESYTSTMSHEFRTPLGTSLTFLEDLMKKDLDPSTLSVLQLITSQLNMLLCLVNDILDLKLIEAGKYESRHEIFEPTSILNFITAMFNPQT